MRFITVRRGRARPWKGAQGLAPAAPERYHRQLGGDVDFDKCWQELGLPTPYNQFWRTHINTSCDSLAFFRVQQKKVEVFARRIQKRLGALSLMSLLDEQALMMIVDQVLGGWSSWKQWQQQQPQQH